MLLQTKKLKARDPFPTSSKFRSILFPDILISNRCIVCVEWNDGLVLCRWFSFDWFVSIKVLCVLFILGFYSQRYLLYYAWKFYQDNTTANARKVFFVTLFYLPAFLLLMIIHSKFILPLLKDKKEENKTQAEGVA